MMDDIVQWQHLIFLSSNQYLNTQPFIHFPFISWKKTRSIFSHSRIAGRRSRLSRSHYVLPEYFQCPKFFFCYTLIAFWQHLSVKVRTIRSVVVRHSFVDLSNLLWGEILLDILFIFTVCLLYSIARRWRFSYTCANVV